MKLSMLTQIALLHFLLVKEDQKNIFELNHRTKASESSGAQGVGFGLYLAQQIVLGHKGTISVISANGKGTTFTITIPKNSG
jgi:signal transduction histidine kinase